MNCWCLLARLLCPWVALLKPIVFLKKVLKHFGSQLNVGIGRRLQNHASRLIGRLRFQPSRFAPS